MIIARQISKHFFSYKKAPGIMASLKSLIHRSTVSKLAVDQFDLSIGPGEIVGLLGPNGAGKTTLMKLFTGIVVPSSGELTVLGHCPGEREIAFRKKIAMVMGQKSQLWWDLPAMDSFHLLRRYYEIKHQDFHTRLSSLAKLLEVTDLLHIQMRKMSLGERMKMELMASLLHQPQLLFLDEPTIGLDLIAQSRIRDFIQKYRTQEPVTIILTSHYMADVQALCERIVLVKEGRKVFDGPTLQFQNILGRDQLVNFSFSAPLSTEHKKFFESWSGIWSNDELSVEVKIPEEKLRETTIEIMKNFPVVNFQSDKLPIERVMKALLERPELHPTTSP